MKTLKFNFLLLLAAALFTLTIQSCKKDKTEDNSDDSLTQIQHSSDESSFSTETENSLDDVNTLMASSSLGKGIIIEGATIDSIIGDKKYVLTYNGLNANGTRFRTGKVTIQLTSGTKWSDVNSVITITYENLNVRNVSTNKSILINGTHVVTNVNGGTISKLVAGGSSVIHKIGGSLTVTFEDNTQRSWTVYRQREIYITSAGIRTIKITGYGSIDGVDNIVVAGINRSGNPFTTIISSPIVVSSTPTCFSGAFIPVSGVKIHKKLTREITVTFGVDANGNSVAGCPYGYKINWTNIRNQAKEAIIGY